MLAWFGLAIAAILNGAIREAVYRDSLGELHAHQLSTLTGILVLGVVIWGMTRMWPIQSSRLAWTIGLAWLTMTVCFEFLFGHFAVGHTWERLLHDYNILEGRVWVLALVWIAVAPRVFYWVHRGGRS